MALELVFDSLMHCIAFSSFWIHHFCGHVAEENSLKQAALIPRNTIDEIDRVARRQYRLLVDWMQMQAILLLFYLNQAVYLCWELPSTLGKCIYWRRFSSSSSSGLGRKYAAVGCPGWNFVAKDLILACFKSRRLRLDGWSWSKEDARWQDLVLKNSGKVFGRLWGFGVWVW